MNIAGKTVLVTGAGTGIGRALALGFTRAGARVALAGRRAAPLEDTAAEVARLGGEALAVPTDVTDRAQVEALVRATRDRFGQIDVLFCNHGSFRSVAPVWEADPDLWWSDVTINVLGTMLLCRAVLPHMIARGSGVIINMEGGGGSKGPNIGGSGYGCAKAALLRFTEGLARELERVGAQVYAFCMDPGFVRTAMTEAIVSTETGRRWQGFVGDWLERGVGKRPEDCVRATLRLLEAATPALNGRAFDTDTDFDDLLRRQHEVMRDGLHLMQLRR